MFEQTRWTRDHGPDAYEVAATLREIDPQAAEAFEAGTHVNIVRTFYGPIPMMAEGQQAETNLASVNVFWTDPSTTQEKSLTLLQVFFDHSQEGGVIQTWVIPRATSPWEQSWAAHLISTNGMPLYTGIDWIPKEAA